MLKRLFVLLSRQADHPGRLGHGWSGIGPDHRRQPTPLGRGRRALAQHAEKPVELAARAMEYSTKRGERVLDLFGGSGSTLIAAEQMGRSALLMEIDPAYCDVIVTRWENLTGKKAKREGAS